MDAVHRILRSRVTWAVGAAALLVGLYALLGFYAAPPLIRSQAIEFVRETYGRELSVGQVGVHPFKLQLEVRDLSLPDADGTPMVGFRRLFVDFEMASLWERAFVFRDVSLDAPTVRAVIRPDGSLNLADLAPPEDDEPDEPVPATWIQGFALTDGTIDLLNQLRRRPVLRHFSPVTFTLRDFRTTAEGGGFHLAARSHQDETFEWKGHFALEPAIVSTGEFRVGRLRVPGVAEFAGDDLPFLLPSGQVDLAGTYDLKVSDEVTLDVVMPEIRLTGLALRARGVEEDWVSVPAVTVVDTRFAFPALTVALGGIALDGLQAKVWMEPDGTLNTDRLFAAAPATAPEAAAPPSPAPASRDPAPPPAQPARTGSDLSLTVGSVTLRDASIDFEDRTVKPAARFTLAPLAATARDASLDLARPLPVEFDATLNGSAKVSGSGQVTPDPLTIDVGVELAKFPVESLQSYANGTTDLRLQRGTIEASGRFTMTPPGSGQPELAFAGDVAIAGFRSIDGALEQDFLNFERVELAKLRFALAPDALSIDRVRVVRPFARVIVSSDQVLNVAAVFDPAGTAAALAARKAEADAKARDASRKKSRAEIRAEKQAAAAAEKARAKAPPPPAPALVETGMPIRIREVTVAGGTMDFADFSVQPNFAAAVQALGGRVTGLSSDPNSRATVKLTGNVGEFSPVLIEGTTQPFAFDRYTDIGLRFENISLPVFNPYSGKFAGYNIAKGKLTTDLHYRIDARKLDAQHRIRIDQLEWGEATVARGEATLPVKFATSLLKDADGVISLDVPVSGTLDDPSFRVGPIVWQVIKNLLSKVVTAPFKALGALFKGAEDAQFVDFAAGQSSLDAASAERLAALGKSLASKPDLRLEVPIGAVAEVDGKALAQVRYEQARQEAMRSVLHGKKRPADEGTALPAYDTLEPDRQLDVLTALYQQLSGAPPALPEPPAPPADLSRKERKARELQSSLDWLETECRARAVVAPGELEQLGQARGEAIQHALLADTGMAPERVFLSRSGQVTPNAPGVRFELAVK